MTTQVKPMEDATDRLIKALERYVAYRRQLDPDYGILRDPEKEAEINRKIDRLNSLFDKYMALQENPA